MSLKRATQPVLLIYYHYLISEFHLLVSFFWTSNMATAAAYNSYATSITITPSKPPSNKRCRIENEPNLKTLENFVHKIGTDDLADQEQYFISIYDQDRPFGGNTEALLSIQMGEIKEMFQSMSIRLLKLDKLDKIELDVKETRKELRGVRKEIEEVKT